MTFYITQYKTSGKKVFGRTFIKKRNAIKNAQRADLGLVTIWRLSKKQAEVVYGQI